jgi:hypothetical protein
LLPEADTIVALAFRFTAVSNIFRRKGADWAVGIISAVIFALLYGSAVALHSQPSVRLLKNGLPFLGFVACCGLSGFLGVRSWRRLWRAGRTSVERVVYDAGVRGVGASMLVATPVIVGGLIWSIADVVHDPGAWIILLVCAFMALMMSIPLWLWAGYIWGQMMTLMLPNDTASRGPTGLPPAA